MIDIPRLRPRLFGIAYRILGTVSDAEDVVGDAFVRWSERETDVREPSAWLTTVTARLAIDRARALARRRETYVGPWLPEPLVDADPAEEVRRADDLALGFLCVLERLKPDERTALLLHDAFDYEHAEISAMLGKSVEAVRQMTARARHRIHEERPRYAVDRRLAADVVRRLISAVRAGSVEDVRALLATDVFSVADGGHRVPAGRRPVVGAARVARLLHGLRTKHWNGFDLQPSTVNGEPGAIVLNRNGSLHAVVGVDVRADRVAALYIVVNPEKLAHVGR